MKHLLKKSVRRIVGAGCLSLLALSFVAPAARAGLTFQLYLYQINQGQGYVFYTPLFTNAVAPAAALGTYVISSPGWPTNGSRRGFELTANNGLVDRYEFDSEHVYGDFNSTLQQITNGNWNILFTNAATTNVFQFTVSAPTITSNMFPATIITFPADGSVILSSQTNFTWQGPTNWLVSPSAQVYNDSYYQAANVPAGQNNWNVDSSIPAGTNYTFYIQYLTNSATAFFVATTPLSTNTAQPISGWSSTSVLDSSISVNFDVVPARGSPSQGHACLAYYTFEDNNLFVHDFSGNGNDMSYAWFSVPPYIVTNDAVAGTYAGGFGGSGWFTPPDGLRSLFAGSFSVSLWLKTTNTYGLNIGDEYSAAGIVSALNSGINNGVMPMGQTGSKLAFYTGGSLLNVLHSQASINTGQYVHVVTTRDQGTGEKRIYVNGVLDATVYSDTDTLNGSSSGGLTIGYNNGNVFTGEMDEIQFYSGILSSNEVAYLHSHPGTNVADTFDPNRPTARYDFEDTNSPGIDSSGHNNNANCSGGYGGTNLDTFSTNAIVGSYARQFFGDTFICFSPGAQSFNNLSNALSGDFSVSAWVNTTNSAGEDYYDANAGAGVLNALNAYTNSVVPISITGSKAAFTIYDQSNNPTTLHSITSVNDGRYHLITVTRTQTNGLMNLYVDGVRQATGTNTTQPIYTPSTIYLGGGGSPFIGLLDDVRIYSGVLSPADVLNLAGGSGYALPQALDATNLTWSVSGDTGWLVETTNTYNGAPAAAQSGSVTNYQSTTLTTTVTGPGNLTFYWSSIANDPNGQFDYEFYIDDPSTNDIADLYNGVNPWQQFGPIHIGPGQHTLGWVVYANGDTDPTQAGYLGQVTFTPPDTSPVYANITLDIYHGQDPTFGDIYVLFPSFASISPAGTGTTTNIVQSPNGYFSSHADAGGGGSGSAILSTLSQLGNECTNGLWTLYINKGLPNERQFNFSATLNGLTTNLLSAVNIITPTNGATGVPANTAFKWTGPTNYPSLTVSKQYVDGSGYASATLPANATNWPSPPVLTVGTNKFHIEYISNSFPNMTFSVPVDTNDSQTVSGWVTQVNLHTTADSIFVVTAAPLPLSLTNPRGGGTNFQFSFQSQTGFTHSILYRTNLAAGSWITYTNITGDGTLKTIPVPFSLFSPSKQGFIRVLTQ